MKTFREFIGEQVSAATSFHNKSQIAHHARAYHRPSTEPDMKAYHKKELIKHAGREQFDKIKSMNWSEVCKL